MEYKHITKSLHEEDKRWGIYRVENQQVAEQKAKSSSADPS